MTKVMEEIANKDLPIAKQLKELLDDTSSEVKATLFGNMTEDEFIEHRVEIFLQQIDVAMKAGFDGIGAEEIAYQECLAGIPLR